MLKRNLLVVFLFASDMMLDACQDNVGLFITAPSKLEALEGSCLQIPCNFQPRDGQELNSRAEIYGVWIKKDSRFLHNQRNVVFNSSVSVQVYPMSLTGNLKENNCSTMFSVIKQKHSDTFYFRVKNGAFSATASCNATQIKVTESPWRPTLVIPRDLKEKDWISVSCSALTPCPQAPPQLSWSLQQPAISHTEQHHQQTFTTNIQQNITLSHQHDGYTINCSASYPVDGGRIKTSFSAVTLNVSYAPKNTSVSVSPSALVSAGSWVNLTCSSKAKPEVSNFSWFRISNGGAIRVSEGDLYSFNLNRGGVYYCVATNHLGHQTSAHILLSVHGSPIGAIVGGITGTLTIICAILVFWWCKSTRQKSENTQTVVLQEAVGADQTKQIHYAEMDFSKMRPQSSSHSSSHSFQQHAVVYSQVKVCKDGRGSAEIGDDIETIYAQIMKK